MPTLDELRHPIIPSLPDAGRHGRKPRIAPVVVETFGGRSRIAEA